MVATTHSAKLSHSDLFAQSDLTHEYKSLEQIMTQIDASDIIKNKLKSKMAKNVNKLAGAEILPIDAFKEKQKKEKIARKLRKYKMDKEDDERGNPGFDPEEASDVSDDDKNIGIDMEFA